MGKQTRILIVDDEPGMVHAVSRVLSRDYTVESCGDPLQSIDLAKKFRPDIAILDIRMPGMDGFSLMRELLRLDPDVDVILMTGNFDEADADLIDAIDSGAFFYLQKPVDRRVMRALVSRCAERRFLQAEREKYLDRIEREINSARRFQQGLLPAPTMRSKNFEVSALFRSCSELAGDFFDYMLIGEERLVFLVADVVGHGAAAAMLTANIKTAFRSVDPVATGPLAIVHAVHDGLQSFDDGRFVPAFCGEITREKDSVAFRYVNAGHPPSFLIHNDEVRSLQSTSPLVSPVFEAETYAEKELPLRPGERVVVYSDGVIESRDEGSTLFGESRLKKCLGGGGSVGDLTQRIDSAVEGFCGERAIEDDVTVLAVSCS